MKITRKIVRKWQSLRMYELRHQYDNVYLFAVDDEDAEQMQAGLYAEWVGIQTGAKMEMPPMYFVKEFYAGLV